MAEVLVAREIKMDDHEDEETRRAIARRFLEVVHADFLRSNASEDLALDLDPTQGANIRRQQAKMEKPADGTVYAELNKIGGDEMVGAVKLGFWKPGDAKPFGAKERAKAMAAETFGRAEHRARGLHVFAVTEERLAKSGILAVRYDINPHTAPLKVAAAEEDEGLNQVLADIQAERGPSGVSDALGHPVSTRLWTIPPIVR